MSSKTILVTGGTGFLGSHLVKAFLKQGHRVVVLKRGSSPLHRLNDVLSRVQFYENGPLPDRVDCLVHAATNYGRPGTSEGEVLEANVHLPLRILREALHSGVKTFLNIDTSLPENVSLYALSKKKFLHEAKQAIAGTSLSFINLRLEQMYGFDLESPSFPMHVIRSLLANVPSLNLTKGEQKRDFVHIDDAVSAVGLLLEKNEQNFLECDLGNGQAVPIAAFVEIVKKLAHSTTALHFGAVPYRENELMHSEAQPDLLRQMGWEPKYSLEEGLKKVIEEYKRANI